MSFREYSARITNIKCIKAGADTSGEDDIYAKLSGFAIGSTEVHEFSTNE